LTAYNLLQNNVAQKCHQTNTNNYFKTRQHLNDYNISLALYALSPFLTSIQSHTLMACTPRIKVPVQIEVSLRDSKHHRKLVQACNLKKSQHNNLQIAWNVFTLCKSSKMNSIQTTRLYNFLSLMYYESIIQKLCVSTQNTNLSQLSLI